MAVDRVNPIGPHSAEETGSDGKVTIRYRVHTTNRDDGATVVLDSSLLPQYGDLLVTWKPDYQYAHRLRCTSRSASSTDSPQWFEVDCEFATGNAGRLENGSQGMNRESQERAQEPLDRPATISKADRDVVVPFITDVMDGKLIQNTANDVFVPPFTTTIRQSVYTIRYRLEELTPLVTMSEKYVNDDDVNFRGTIWPAYSLLIDSISFDDEIWHQGDHYYPMTATVIGDTRTFARKVLNDGLYQIGRVPTAKSRCMVGGEAVQYPVPLNKDGGQITDAELAADPLGAPHYLYFFEFEELDFTGIFPDLS
tara:strand:- start:4270 stop:5199 length:930 start_codon:yes stop_codon:yes gene_type:complete